MATDDALDVAIDVLGGTPTEITDGVFRSGDDNFQLRMTDSDLGGSGTGRTPHMNFESDTTVTKPNGKQSFDVQENKHILLPEEQP